MTTIDNEKYPSETTKPEPSILTLEAMNNYILNPGNANYQRKVQLLNDAMQEVGMGQYQWYVFR